MEKNKESLVMKLIPVVLILVVILSFTNIFMLQERKADVIGAQKILEEELRPAKLELIKIKAENCDDSCYDIEEFISELKKQNVNITNEREVLDNSPEGESLISRYSIQKLPTIILSGEVNKSEQLTKYFEENGEITDNNFLYSSLRAPYYNNVLKMIVGLVSITHVVDSSCQECANLSSISDLFKEQGVFITSEKVIEYDSEDGQKLITQFGIKEVPAILISNEINYYPEIKQTLEQAEVTEKDNYYALHSTSPPYRNISKNEIIGLVDVIYLTKSDCPVCYDVTVNRNILLGFGMVIKNENTYDINSEQGTALIKKYDIVKAPIILVSPDGEVYDSFVQAWKSVGTVEKDAWFVMRNPELLGTYWDLENKRAVQVGDN